MLFQYLISLPRHAVLFLLSAYLFSNGYRKPKAISNVLGISERQILNWAISPLWKPTTRFFGCLDDAEMRGVERHRRAQQAEDAVQFRYAEKQWVRFIKRDIHIDDPDAFLTRRQKARLPEQIGVERLHWSYFPRKTLALLAHFGLSLFISLSIIFSGGTDDKKM